MDTEERWFKLERAGLVRLVCIHDPHHSFEDYEGDMYSPKANPDRDPDELRKEREEARVKFYSDGGAYTFSGEISLEGEWQHIDSVGGMYPLDWAKGKDNPYRSDIMEAVLERVDQLLEEIGATWKAGGAT